MEELQDNRTKCIQAIADAVVDIVSVVLKKAAA